MTPAAVGRVRPLLRSGGGMAKKRTDTRTLTEFKRGTAAVVRRLKRTGRPLTLTVDGRPTLVMLDVGAYRELRERLQRAEEAEMRKFLQQSMADIDAGRTVPAVEFLQSLGTPNRMRP